MVHKCSLQFEVTSLYNTTVHIWYMIVSIILKFNQTGSIWFSVKAAFSKIYIFFFFLLNQGYQMSLVWAEFSDLQHRSFLACPGEYIFALV